MYKHARGRRTAAQDKDAREDEKFHKKNLKAAGVSPPMSDELYRRLILVLAFWPKKKRPSATEIAHQLNSREIPNAIGEQWTVSQVKTFLHAHFPHRVPPL